MWRIGTFSFFDSGVFLANILPRWLDTISSAPLAQNMASCQKHGFGLDTMFL
jgi:hypothetical protein